MWAAIVGAIGAVIASIVSYFGRKGVVSAATVAAFIALTAALIASLKALFVAVLTWTAVPSAIRYGLGVFIPSDFTVVLGAIVSARAVRAAYDIAVEKVKVISGAN